MKAVSRTLSNHSLHKRIAIHIIRSLTSEYMKCNITGKYFLRKLSGVRANDFFSS